jgi:hypothetical protein
MLSSTSILIDRYGPTAAIALVLFIFELDTDVEFEEEVLFAFVVTLEFEALFEAGGSCALIDCSCDDEIAVPTRTKIVEAPKENKNLVFINSILNSFYLDASATFFWDRDNQWYGFIVAYNKICQLLTQRTLDYCIKQKINLYIEAHDRIKSRIVYSTLKITNR